MAEDTKGLRVEGALSLDVQQGREAYALLKQGALNGLSIGFFTQDDSYDETTRVRHLKKFRFMEVSLVTFPANDKANVDPVNSAPDTVRGCESFLRDAGFSQGDAKIITARGFKALQAHREGGDLAAVAGRLTSLTETVRKYLPVDLERVNKGIECLNESFVGLKKALPRPLKGDMIIFRGKPIRDVDSGWRKLVSAPGLPGRITPYSLRHTVAKWLRSKGVPPWEVSSVLSHAIRVSGWRSGTHRTTRSFWFRCSCVTRRENLETAATA